MKIGEYRKIAKKSKYNSKKSGGYDSKKEHCRAVTLRLQEEYGLISHLYEQVKFELIPSQYEYYKVIGKRKMLDMKKCIEKSCSYIADFVYFDNEKNVSVIEDSKGVRTEVYKIKKKLMLFRYNIVIKET